MRTRLMAAAAAAALLMAGSAYAQNAGQSDDNAHSHAHATAQDRAQDQTGDRGNGGMQNTGMQPGAANDRDRDRDNMGSGDRDRTRVNETTNMHIRSHTTRITEIQKTKIKEVFRGRPGPRLTHVTFRIGVGAFVPRSVRIVAVPPEIVSIYPEWEGYSYFETADEIVIIDPMSFAIVGVLPL